MTSVPYLISLGLLAGALLLGATTAQALVMGVRGQGRWARWPVMLVAKTALLFPLSALLWSAIGCWVGHLGLPVSSLMPAPVTAETLDLLTRIAHVVWWWAPPVFLLSLPVACQLVVSSLMTNRPWFAQVRRAGLLGLALLPVVEDAFHLPGILAGLIPALHHPGATSFLLEFAPLLMLGGVWWCLASAWPHAPVPHIPTDEDKIREGALVIGLSPQEVWKRHLMHGRVRRGLARLCSAAALAFSLWIAYGCPGSAAWSTRLRTAFDRALYEPIAPLSAVALPALCALSLWLLGRIILPRPRQTVPHSYVPSPQHPRPER